MQRRRIVVIGYPKSGSTWVTRLTAQLLGAPVTGFWGEPDTVELASEGVTRISRFAVFKSHHPYAGIGADVNLRDVVYVVRDVRDVAVSGACYFALRPREPLARLACSLRKRLTGAAGKTRENARKVREMLRVLSEGDVWPSPWCARPWDRHVADYLRARAFVLRYEDLLAAPERECSRLLRHLGVERSATQIRDAIATQSFVAVKQRSLSAGKVRHARFLREGRSGEWVERLSPEQSAFCAERFGSMLALLDYEPSRHEQAIAADEPHLFAARPRFASPML